MKYGIYDTKDKCWMGNSYGPILYTDEEACRAAATVCGERFEAPTRYRCKPFTDKDVHLKDVVTPTVSAEDAIKKIEAKP